MHPSSKRNFATRTLTSYVLPALVLGAALSLTPVSGANAQHGGSHHGHHGHLGHGAKKKPVKQAPAKKRRAAKAGSHYAAKHGRLGVGASDTLATREFKVAHERMMANMALAYTGDPDVDFRAQMIPHHRGAIDMARVAMRHARDPWTRQLAEAVIVEQQREIAEMQAWLQRQGAIVPTGGQPTHVIRADSYRAMQEEPGTRAELRGQSWAPGSGVPALGER